jgi:hypothetical protein
MGRPAGLPGFGRAVIPAGLLLNPDRSSYRVDPPGRAGFNNCGFQDGEADWNCALNSKIKKNSKKDLKKKIK